jgi:flagellin
MIIGASTSSLTIQRHLGKTQNSISSSMERLSSGKRINAASDDAAGLSISNRLAAAINGYGQAVRNGGDAVSLIQVADGALEEVTSMLQRMRALAVQASSDTYSDVDRSAINVEFTALANEIERTSVQTSFNTIPVINLEDTLRFQLGPSANDSISLSLEDMGTASIGNEGVNALGSTSLTSLTSGDVSNSIPATASFTFNSWSQPPVSSSGDLVLSGGNTVEIKGLMQVQVIGDHSAGDSMTMTVGSTTFSHTFVSSGNSEATIQEFVTAWNADNASAAMYTATTSLSSYINFTEVVGADGPLTGAAIYAGATLSGYQPINMVTGAAADILTVTVGSTTFTHTFDDPTLTGNAYTSARALANAWNADSTASASYTAYYPVPYGRVRFLEVVPTGTAVSGTATYTGKVSGDSFVGNGTVGYAGDKLTVTVGSTSYEHAFVRRTSAVGAADDFVTAWNADSTASSMYIASRTGGVLTFTEVTPTSGLLVGTALTGTDGGINEASLLTVSSSAEALTNLDIALSDVNGYRATLGATSNRIEFAISNGMNSVMNHKAALSRIMDADFAVETTKLAQTQILQQAGLAMVNTSRGDVLALIKGML